MSAPSLSNAIRLGAMTTRQTFGISLTDDREGACALGCAMIACGLADDEEDELLRLFPVLRTTVPHPVRGDDDRRRLIDMIAILNDRHLWSRERIAGWVETLEEPAALYVSHVAIES